MQIGNLLKKLTYIGIAIAIVCCSAKLQASWEELTEYDYKDLKEVARLCHLAYGDKEAQSTLRKLEKKWAIEYLTIPSNSSSSQSFMVGLKATLGPLNVISYIGVNKQNPETFHSAFCKSAPKSLSELFPHVHPQIKGHSGILEFYEKLGINRPWFNSENPSVLFNEAKFKPNNFYDQSFIFAGHSMGGALAQLGGLEFCKLFNSVDESPKMSIVSFASPAFLSLDAASEFGSGQGFHNLRIHYGSDLISSLTRGALWFLADIQYAEDPAHRGLYHHLGQAVDLGTTFEGYLGHEIRVIMDTVVGGPYVLTRYWGERCPDTLNKYLDAKRTNLNVNIKLSFESLKMTLGQIPIFPELFTTLKTIMLFRTNFNDRKTRELLDVLPRLENLTDLSLGRLSIGRDGAKDFKNYLSSDPALENLTITELNITPQTLKKALKGLSGNRHFKTIDIMGGLPPSHIKVLIHSFKRNKQLPSIFFGMYLVSGAATSSYYDLTSRIDKLKYKRIQEHEESCPLQNSEFSFTKVFMGGIEFGQEQAEKFNSTHSYDYDEKPREFSGEKFAPEDVKEFFRKQNEILLNDGSLSEALNIFSIVRDVAREMQKKQQDKMPKFEELD